MPFRLNLGVSELCDFVKGLLSQPLFVEAIQETQSTIQDGKLYWNLHENQGYVVVDTELGKAYRVFELSEPLSDKFPCDPALAILVCFDIDRFVDLVNGIIDSDTLILSVMSTSGSGPLM